MASAKAGYRIIRGVVGLIAATMMLAIADRAAAADCEFEVLGEGRVSSIVDARTIRLDDGRDIRLDGIEIANASIKPAADVTTLTRLLLGYTVTLRGESDAPARYGRQRALVFRGDEPAPVQSVLLAEGAALVSGSIAEPGCAATLLAAEATARTARRGVWADPAVIKNAESPGDILTRIGQYTLVEGKVLSARQAGATFYVNFGRRWTRDFAVTIPRRSMSSIEQTGIPLSALANRRIRVRGWIEQRGGPRIEVSRPGQIELAE
jgi:endonuclease YncB( thermonuclease family)